MNPVLVHIDPDAGAVGAWTIDEAGLLVSYYPGKGSEVYALAARTLIDARGNDVPLLEWFRRLDGRFGYTAGFVLIERPTAPTLAQTYTAFAQTV